VQEKPKMETMGGIGWEAGKHESWDCVTPRNDELGVKREDWGDAVDMRNPEVPRRARGGPASRHQSVLKIKHEERDDDDDDGNMRKEVGWMARGGPASRNAGEPKVKQESVADDDGNMRKEVARRAKGGPASRRRGR